MLFGLLKRKKSAELNNMFTELDAAIDSLKKIDCCAENIDVLPTFKKLAEGYRRIRETAYGFIEGKSGMEIVSEVNKELDEIKINNSPIFDKLAWLEHRRWCAFMRTDGFRRPSLDEENSYVDKTKNHKSLLLKLHPCIVECDELGMKEDIRTSDEKLDDMLDSVTRRMMKNKIKNYDFKKYDYPYFE